MYWLTLRIPKGVLVEQQLSVRVNLRDIGGLYLTMLRSDSLKEGLFMQCFIREWLPWFSAANSVTESNIAAIDAYFLGFFLLRIKTL